MTYDPTTPLSPIEAAEAKRLITGVYDALSTPAPVPTTTSYRDPTEPPAYGPTPHVPQPETRIVPSWAAGTALVSIAAGAGATGLGCAAWLFFKGLSLVSVPSLDHFALIVVTPFAGAAMLAAGIGAAIAKAKSGTTTNVFEGPVTQNTEINNTSHTSWLGHTRNDIG
ncbi:hypothetical protein [Streptomyces fuscichromogenes]|uniref:Transmembrane protein n=1 Tax=Streptomyces fuscichromogenes TaxID=1324013 RepID=A0A917XN71_9ACTN|nr:hypothetical protein [Streptomyces fuscichromogenes]GGN41278.1 hypothetical protein GCM10011578_089410 [Streptomyces fuscichromogenes]